MEKASTPAFIMARSFAAATLFYQQNHYCPRWADRIAPALNWSTNISEHSHLCTTLISRTVVPVHAFVSSTTCAPTDLRLQLIPSTQMRSHDPLAYMTARDRRQLLPRTSASTPMLSCQATSGTACGSQYCGYTIFIRPGGTI